jgi:hypothetical protein
VLVGKAEPEKTGWAVAVLANRDVPVAEALLA